MKRICRQIQTTLADGGPEALRASEAAQEHIAACDDCFQVLEAAAEVDRGLAQLPPLDAPDAVVESLLERVAAEPLESRVSVPEGKSADRGRWPWLAFVGNPSLRWATVALIVVGIVGLMNLRHSPSSVAPQVSQVRFKPPPARGQAVPSETSEDQLEELNALGYLGGDDESKGKANGAESRRCDLGALLRERERQESPEPKAKKVPIPDPEPMAEIVDVILEIPDTDRIGPLPEGFAEERMAQLETEPRLEAKRDRDGTDKERLEDLKLESDLEQAQAGGRESLYYRAEADDSRETAPAGGELENLPPAPDPWAAIGSQPGVLADRINVGDNESAGRGAKKSIDRRRPARPS